MDINSLAVTSILELAVEDRYPAWELLWRLRTILPSHSDKELRHLVIESIESLLRNGSIDIYCSSDNGEVEPCRSIKSIEALLSDDDVWKPEGSFQVYVISTDKGDDDYYKGAGTKPKTPQ